MFKIKYISNIKNNYLEISDSENKTLAKISLDQGGRLQELKLKNKLIITDLNPLEYNKTYASAILFPFVNRINKGMYTFNGKQYLLEINDKEYNHAIHGLIYNKTFELISSQSFESSALVKLQYEENNYSIGFPFKYKIELIYSLTSDSVNLEVVVKNTDVNPFPFNIGWHPYFYSNDLYHSWLKFNCQKKILLNEKMIPKGDKIINSKIEMQIKDNQFDDCFALHNNEIIFNTPKYAIAIQGTSIDSYLQIYTPKNRNYIAIEPTTSLGDSFNNKLGLMILKPNEIYKLDWKINIEKVKI